MNDVMNMTKTMMIKQIKLWKPLRIKLLDIVVYFMKSTNMLLYVSKPWPQLDYLVMYLREGGITGKNKPWQKGKSIQRYEW